MADRDPFERALKLLVEAAERKIVRHPGGHLVSGPLEPLELEISIPLLGSEDRVARAAEQLECDLETAVDGMLTHAAVVRPGRVFCLRCRSAACDHSAPLDLRQVFASYGPSGTPRFVEFAQFLLDRKDPRIDRLYDEPTRLVAVAQSEDELSAELLPPFRDGGDACRLHGQVVAGYYRAPTPSGRATSLAVSLQLISSPRGRRRRYALNIVAAPRGDESLERLFDRVGEPPWRAAVRWAQSALGQIGAAHGPRSAGVPSERRLSGVLAGLARRIERGERARDRRTQHAAVRHDEGLRPTRMALADLERAGPAQVLFDVRRGTLVVLGERGRAHIFNASGKLVTSVRYPPASVSRRRDSGLWRPAVDAEVSALRAAANTFDGNGTD